MTSPVFVGSNHFTCGIVVCQYHCTTISSTNYVQVGSQTWCMSALLLREMHRYTSMTRTNSSKLRFPKKLEFARRVLLNSCCRDHMSLTDGPPYPVLATFKLKSELTPKFCFMQYCPLPQALEPRRCRPVSEDQLRLCE